MSKETNGLNSHGLYDAPVRSDAPRQESLSREELDRELERGAFVITEAEALEAGFLSPYDAQDVTNCTGGGMVNGEIRAEY